MQNTPPTDFAPTWKWWLPPNYSSFGREVDQLYYWVFGITMVTFVLVEAAMLWFCFKYRRNPARKAIYTHGSHALEVTWTLIPALILIALGVLSSGTWAKIKNPADPRYPKEFQTEIKITAQQFQWNVTYPGADGRWDTPDDFPTKNLIVVPYERVDSDKNPIREENVRVMLSSIDVIHSFFCPVLRLKQDAVPGFVGNVWFDVQERPTSKGRDGLYWFDHPEDSMALDDDEVYEVACAELCGLGHSQMKAQLKALPREDWERWVAKESAKVLKK